MALATNSVPVPISPVIKTVQSVAAAPGTYTSAGSSASEEPKISSSSCKLSISCGKCRGSSWTLFDFRFWSLAARPYCPAKVPCLCRKSLIQKSSAVGRLASCLFVCMDSSPKGPGRIGCQPMKAPDPRRWNVRNSLLGTQADERLYLIELGVPRRTVCYAIEARLLRRLGEARNDCQLESSATSPRQHPSTSDRQQCHLGTSASLG